MLGIDRPLISVGTLQEHGMALVFDVKTGIIGNGLEWTMLRGTTCLIFQFGFFHKM